MADGFLVDKSCWSTESEAIDAHYSALLPQSFIDSTGTVYTLMAEKVSGAWVLKHVGSTGTVISSYPAPTSVYGSCTIWNDPTTNFFLGMELGQGVAIVMLVTLAIRSMVRRY